MAWDPNRPIPWRRLLRDWAIYAAVMAVIFTVFFRESTTSGTFVGLAVSLPIYLSFGAVLAKFGYQRKSMSEIRAQSAARTAARDADRPSGSAPAARPRPAPTRRTGGGPSKRRR